MTITLNKVIPDYLEQDKVGRSAIWNKNIKFNKGQKIQIVAPSGSGKTSLIHFLYGIRRDYKGEILFNSKNTAASSTEECSALRRNNVSIIFQDLRLFGDHTVQKNLEIKRALNPVLPEHRIPELLARLGMEDKLHRVVKTCSYGEQQRIAIIRALLQPFDFLLMDEPFSHLDEGNREKAITLIEEEVNERKAGMILADLQLVSHLRTDNILQL